MSNGFPQQMYYPSMPQHTIYGHLMPNAQPYISQPIGIPTGVPGINPQQPSMSVTTLQPTLSMLKTPPVSPSHDPLAKSITDATNLIDSTDTTEQAERERLLKLEQEKRAEEIRLAKLDLEEQHQKLEKIRKLTADSELQEKQAVEAAAAAAAAAAEAKSETERILQENEKKRQQFIKEEEERKQKKLAVEHAIAQAAAKEAEEKRKAEEAVAAAAEVEKARLEKEAEEKRKADEVEKARLEKEVEEKRKADEASAQAAKIISTSPSDIIQIVPGI